MITKTHKGDLGLGVPEKKKKKKKKKKVKELETQYSVLSYDDYFVDASPVRATSPSKNGGKAQAHEMPLVKKKKKKKSHNIFFEEQLDSEPVLCARRTETSPSPKKQAPGHSESFSKEKKKKRKSLSLITSHGLVTKTSPDTRNGEEVTRVGKKLKKHKKGKKTEDAAAFSSRDQWFYEAGDAPYTGSLGKEGGEQAALGQKRKQGSSREHSVKMKKKKKIHQEGDALLGHRRLSRSTERSPRKGSKKQLVTLDVPEYTPVGDGPKSPVKKKVKSKKKTEQPAIEELILKRKKKKRKESGIATDPWEEEPDTDLEVVLEKKGNMDEAHIDQVRRKALQEEIDRESGKTEASEDGKWMETKFGQWDTAGFENEEQKLKFLKLMGGFKNLTPSFSHPPSMIGRPNMALNKKAVDALQQNLQQDYDRAMSWKYNRGAGLGFTTTPSKVFFIDRNASRSVKLED